MDSNTLIKQYVSIVQKIARVEHRRIPNHMIEYEELVSIGIIAIQTLIKDKTETKKNFLSKKFINFQIFQLNPLKQVFLKSVQRFVEDCTKQY